MIVLGLNYHHGDASACIVKDGQLLTAVEEERFVGIKHSSDFPINSIKFCLSSNNLNPNDIDFIAVNKKKNYNFFVKLKYILSSFYNFLNLKFFFSFLINKQRDRQLELIFSKQEIKEKLVEVPHHLSHVFSTMFFLNKNDNALVYSFDGSGDFSTIEAYVVNNKNYKLIEKQYFPNSLGFFYSAFTQFLGFRNYGDEYKVMSLAAYGNPVYKEKVNKLIKNYDPFKLEMKYFNLPIIDYSKTFPIINTIYNQQFIKLFTDPRKNSDREINKIYKDIASSFQKVFEDVVMENLKKLKKVKNSKKVYLTGGCAFNSLLVGNIIKSKMFEEVVLGPNPGDAGGAVGAAFYTTLKKIKDIPSVQELGYLGNEYSNDFIKSKVIDKFLEKEKYKSTFFENFNDLSSYIAKKIYEDDVIFWFQDKMEWGPRALGNRSILANPSKKEIKEIINKKIKKRENFRPFAPVILKEDANNYFEMHNYESKYMNIVFNAKKITSEKFSGVVNVDNTSRVQTIDKKDNFKLYNLISKYKEITGCPMLINTSLNVKGPIAQTPLDAFLYFKKTDVKCLVLNNWVIELNE